MRKIKKRSACAVSSSLDVLGDKWTLLIIRDLIFHNKSSYGDFLGSAEKIATNILADRLALLEDNGIVIKHIHPENKSKYIYKLTQKGIDLMPVIAELILWGEKYIGISENGKIFAGKYKKNKTAALKELRDKIQL